MSNFKIPAYRQAGKFQINVKCQKAVTLEYNLAFGNLDFIGTLKLDI
jgi:hypothetical protein